MGVSKRPSIPASKRPTVPRASSRGVEPPADLAKRVSDCEADIRALRAEIDSLRSELLAVRARTERPQGEAALIASRARKFPPPLPAAESSDEIIAVDASEVVLESIRPPAPRRPGKS